MSDIRTTFNNMRYEGAYTAPCTKVYTEADWPDLANASAYTISKTKVVFCTLVQGHNLPGRILK